MGWVAVPHQNTHSDFDLMEKIQITSIFCVRSHNGVTSVLVLQAGSDNRVLDMGGKKKKKKKSSDVDLQWPEVQGVSADMNLQLQQT